MIYRLPPLNALRVFEAAARHLSFKEAAQELSITQAAVSHQVKSLEEYLGVELFRRAGRGVQLTEAARACLPKLREGFESLAAGVELSGEGAAETEILITAPPVFSRRCLSRRPLPQAAFILHHPHARGVVAEAGGCACVAAPGQPRYRVGQAVGAVQGGAETAVGVLPGLPRGYCRAPGGGGIPQVAARAGGKYMSRVCFLRHLITVCGAAIYHP